MFLKSQKLPQISPQKQFNHPKSLLRDSGWVNELLLIVEEIRASFLGPQFHPNLVHVYRNMCTSTN